MAKITSDMLVFAEFDNAQKVLGKELNYCVAYIRIRVEREDIVDTKNCRIYRPTTPVVSLDVCLDFYETEDDALEQISTIEQEHDDAYIKLLRKQN